jgi:hypothetical protein
VTVLAGEGLGLAIVLQLQSGRGLVVPILVGLLVGAAWMVDLWRSGPARAALAGALLAAVALGADDVALALLAIAAIDAARGGGAWRLAAGLVIGVICAEGALASWWPVVPGTSRVDGVRATLVAGAAAFACVLRSWGHAVQEPALRHAWLLVPATFVAALGALSIEVPWAPRERPDDGLRRWARTTPVDTLFAVPDRARGFRAAALRSSIFEPHDVHASFFSRRYALEWIGRRRRFADDVPLGRREQALRDGTIDVLVTTKHARRLKEPVAYEDEWYVAYVRPGSPLAEPGPRDP